MHRRSARWAQRSRRTLSPFFVRRVVGAREKPPRTLYAESETVQQCRNVLRGELHTERATNVLPHQAGRPHARLEPRGQRIGAPYFWKWLVVSGDVTSSTSFPRTRRRPASGPRRGEHRRIHHSATPGARC